MTQFFGSLIITLLMIHNYCLSFVVISLLLFLLFLLFLLSLLLQKCLTNLSENCANQSVCNILLGISDDFIDVNILHF